VALSDDPEFSKKAEAFKSATVLNATGEEYVSKMSEQFKELEDRLCRVPYNEDEGGWKSKRIISLYLISKIVYFLLDCLLTCLNLVAVSKYSKGDFSYPPHLDQKAIQEGIKTNKFHQGAYRSFNFYEGCVRIDTGEERNPLIKRKPGVFDPNEVLLQGLPNINRASEGDIVVIEILPEDQWSVASGMIVEEAPEKEPELVADEIVRDNAEEVNKRTLPISIVNVFFSKSSNFFAG